MERQTELDPLAHAFIDTFAHACKTYTDEQIEAACKPLREELEELRATITVMLEGIGSLKSDGHT